MKKIIIMASVFVLFSNTLFSSSLYAKSITDEVKIKNIENSQWELAKEQNGIQIFFKTIAKDGVFQLRIKFVNMKNETIKFGWSLVKNSDSLFEEIESEVVPNGEVEKDENLIIPFNSGDSFNDFLITLKII